MSSQDVNNILRSLPPGSIQYIEVIRNPSAKFAASSSGGVINVVLKKGVKIGRFGTVSAGMNQGYYGNQFLNLSMNNSGDRTTSYINLNINNNQSREELNSVRLLQQETSLVQSAVTRRNSNQGLIGYGVALEYNDRISYSYDGRINGSLPGSATRNLNSIQSADGLPISEARNFVNNDSRFVNVQQDLGMKYRLDTLGSEIDTKLNYAYITNNTLQDYQDIWYYPISYNRIGDGDNNQQRHLIQFQSDLTKQLAWQVKLEAGINASYQDYQSEADYFITSGDKRIHDLKRTNAFNYQENINAAYLQASRPLPLKFLLKAGVRLEQTYMKGLQTLPADTSFVINRADWFPYVYLSRPLFSIADFELRGFLIYRRTITRPGYQSLNPYVNYLDHFLYEAGNPGLKPQFADNIEANISMNDWPVFAVGRNNTRDIFSSVVYRDPVDSLITIRTYDNLGSGRETYFRAIAGIPPRGRYFFVVGTQYNMNEFDGQYDGKPFSYKKGSWRFFTFHMLRLGPDTRLTMNGFMMNSGQMNFYELQRFGQLNLGLNQTFLNKKLTITLSARDVLRTMVTRFDLNQGGITTSGDRYTDNQRFGFNIRYNFGINNRKERQQQNMFQFETE
jgi:iron complex outermembrane recepter protein